MKLYLSSYQLGNQKNRLRDLLGPRKTAGIILNAADAYGDSKRPEYFARFAADFASMGISSKEIDLRKFFGKPESLKEEIQSLGLIWMSGGNTFVLRRALRESGLEQLLPGLLRNSDLVCGGFSAGACVLSPTLQGIHLADEPEVVPPGYLPSIIWEGLNLVDFYLAPHFRSNHPESEAMEGVVGYYREKNLPYYALKDGEALSCVDGAVEVLH